MKNKNKIISVREGRCQRLKRNGDFVFDKGAVVYWRCLNKLNNCLKNGNNN